jgi:hypothetical protein
MQMNDPFVFVGLCVVLECESNGPLVAFRVLGHVFAELGLLFL